MKKVIVVIVALVLLAGVRYKLEAGTRSYITNQGCLSIAGGSVEEARYEELIRRGAKIRHICYTPIKNADGSVDHYDLYDETEEQR